MLVTILQLKIAKLTENLSLYIIGTKKSLRKNFVVTTYNVLCSHFKSRISKNKGIPVLQILGEFLPFEDVQMTV